MSDIIHLGDHGMQENHIGDDIVWGFKSWTNEQSAVVYAMEVRFRIPGDDRIAYVRESRVGDPKAAQVRVVAPHLVGTLVDVLTDAKYREALHEAFFRDGWDEE